MLLPKYKFYINSIEVKPIYNKLSKKYERESNEYFFRESIEGTIKLLGTDFWLIANSGIEQVFNFVIKKLNSETSEYYDYYSSSFTKTDCKLNFDKQACTFKIDKHDRYTDILNKYENSINMLKYGLRARAVNIFKRGRVQIYISNNTRLSNFIGGGTYWEQDCESTNDYNRLVNICGFSRTTLVHSIRVSTRDNSTGDLITLGQKLPGLYTGYVDVAGLAAHKTIFAMTYKFMNSKYRVQAYIDFSDCTIRTNLVDENGTDLDAAFNGIFDNETNTRIYEYAGAVSLTSEESAIYLAAYKFKLASGQTAVNEQTEIYVFMPAEEYIYARLLCDVPEVQGVAGVTLPADDIAENTSNYRYAVRYAIPSTYISYNFTTKEAPFGNNSLGQYYLPPTSYGIQFLPVNRSYWPDAYSIWFDFGHIYPQIDESSKKVYALRDGYFIGDVINCLLKRIAPNITHEATEEYSKFLYSDTNPLGFPKFYLFITQKTNILKGEYDKPAQKAEITFKELMEMLYNCFKLRWFIDDNNRLRIEHISWFMNGKSYSNANTSAAIDLTVNSDYRNLKALAKFQNEIEYDKSDLAAHFEFSWMDDCTRVFEGTDLNIISNYIDKSKDESISASKFTPDVDYMLAEPSAFAEDGFALLCAIKNNSGSYELPLVNIPLVDSFNGAQYTASVQNGYASWLYLLNFYMYDLPGPSIEYDYLAPYTLFVRGVKRCMQQKVEFPCEEDPDIFGNIKTERGVGIIDSMSVNMVNRQVSTTLNFAPA